MNIKRVGTTLIVFAAVFLGFSEGTSGKEPTCQYRRLKRYAGSVSGLGTSLGGGGHGDPLQYSCLENPRDGGASQSMGCKELAMMEVT